MSLKAVMKKQLEHDGRFGQLEAQMTVVKTDVSVLRLDLRDLRSEVHRLGVTMEHRWSQMDQILEIVLFSSEQLRLLTGRDSKLDDHEHRISALESAVRHTKPLGS